jgi:hypothetical protein
VTSAIPNCTNAQNNQVQAVYKTTKYNTQLPSQKEKGKSRKQKKASQTRMLSSSENCFITLSRCCWFRVPSRRTNEMLLLARITMITPLVLNA